MNINNSWISFLQMHSNQISHFKQIKEIPLGFFCSVWTEYDHLSRQTIQE